MPLGRLLDRDCTDSMFDSATNLIWVKATGNKQLATRTVLNRRKGNRDPRGGPKPGTTKHARQGARHRHKRRARELLTGTQLKPAAVIRQPVPTPHPPNHRQRDERHAGSHERRETTEQRDRKTHQVLGLADWPAGFPEPRPTRRRGRMLGQMVVASMTDVVTHLN
jgi:hypothetical protein